MEIQENDYLWWQQAIVPQADNASLYPAPREIRKNLPNWYTELPGNLATLKQTLSDHDVNVMNDHSWRSAKFCMGIKGIRTVGWTIPLARKMNEWAAEPQAESWKEALLHPEMLHGSCWTEKIDNDEYFWDLKLVSFPWRAKMSRGWRLMITAHPLEWSRDWFCFSGCVDANYQILADNRNIGSMWNYDHEIETDYNYYNIEMVIAFRVGKTKPNIIPQGTCFFSLVPIWDPEYKAPEFRGLPHFNTNEIKV